jgi:2-phospho-L-lactate/phosphoenolpyruvate guanylyltransferase
VTDVFRALILLRSLERGKSRLAPALSAAARRALVRAMFQTVCAALADEPRCRALHLLTRDRADAAAPAVDSPCIVESDTGRGLNAEIGRVLARHGRTDEAWLVIAADLPLLDAAAVASLVRVAESTRCVVVRDRSLSGTNALWLRDASAFATRFGPGSAARHLAEAARCGLSAQTFDRREFALDVDTPADLSLLRRGFESRIRPSQLSRMACA